MGWFSSISNFFNDHNNQSTSFPKPKYFLCTIQLNCNLFSFYMYIQCCPFPCGWWESTQNFTIINTDPTPTSSHEIALNPSTWWLHPIHTWPLWRFHEGATVHRYTHRHVPWTCCTVLWSSSPTHTLYHQRLQILSNCKKISIYHLLGCIKLFMQVIWTNIGKHCVSFKTSISIHKLFTFL